MFPVTQLNRQLSVRTPLDFDVLLIDSFVGTEGVSRPFRLDVMLLADVTAGKHLLVDPDKLVGKGMTIAVELAGGERRFFHGIVKRFHSGSARDRFVRYRAELVPWLSLLSLTSDCRMFQEMSVPDIIEAVFTELGFKDFRFALNREYTKWDYCVQYRETDFNFVTRLMEQEGIFYYFEHAEDAHTLVLADSVAAYTECPGQETVIFGPQLVESEDIITSWETGQELLSGKWVLRDYHFEMPTKTLQVEEPAQEPAEIAQKLDTYDYPGEYAQKFNNPGKRLGVVTPEGEAVVQLRMQGEELNRVVIEGASTCRAFGSGFKIRVVSRGVVSVSGSYFLTSVQHSAVQSPNYFSGQNLDGAGYSNQFTCIPAEVPFRPPRSTPKPVIQGPQTARVVDETKDPSALPSEEIWPDKFGRVRVRFPWDREGKYSCWVRVAQPWAGKGWGHQWIPRVGHEVIVDFLEGDPDCPIIVGSVYNADNMPPYSLPDNKTQTGIKTRSSKGGGSSNFNMIRFEDKKGHEQLAIHAERDMATSVESNQTTTVGGNRSITTGGEKDGVKSGDVKELVHKDHHLHVKGDHRDMTDGECSHIVTGDAFEWHRASHRTTTASEEFVEAPTVVVEAGQTLSLKGPGGFIVIDASGVTIVGTMVKINSGGAAAVSTIGGGPISGKADEAVDP